MEDHTSKSVNCRASIEDLYRYMDGHVDERQREQIQHHLSGCGVCGEVVDFESTIQKMIGHKCRSEMPDGLQQRVFGTIIGPDFGADFRTDRQW